jgi:hypothetical protein
MKRFFIGVLAVAFLVTPTFALASSLDAEPLQTAGIQMTDAEMDNITAGALLNVTVKNIDVAVQNNDIVKDVNVNAAVAAAVLGAAGSAAKITD